MELRILELKKMLPEDQNERGIIRWMSSFGGKKRRRSERMMKKDEYIEEVYGDLKKLSMNDRKRME